MSSEEPTNVHGKACVLDGSRGLKGMRKSLIIGLLIGGLFPVLDCSDPNAQASPIVREVEANGSGNISGTTTPELAAWFAKKQEFANHIAQECAPLYKRADANWTQRTAEGRVCTAAQSVAFVPPKADQRRW